MGMGFMPTVGVGDMLEYLIRLPVFGVVNWYLVLWTNDLEPDCDTVLADLTLATFTGYNAVELIRENWTVPTVGTCCAHSTYTTEPQVWYVTGGPVETIYGYAFVDPTTSKLRFIQRLDPADIAPIEIGGRVLLLPVFTLTSAECA